MSKVSSPGPKKMTVKKRRTVPTASSLVSYKFGSIEARMDINEEQHKTILTSLGEIKEAVYEAKQLAAVVTAEAKIRDKQHGLILDKVNQVCNALDPINIAAAAVNKQVEINSKRLEKIEDDFPSLSSKVEGLVGKATLIGTVASFLVAILFYIGKLIISHISVGSGPPLP